MPRTKPKEATISTSEQLTHQITIGACEYWCDDWTVRDLVQSLEDLPSRRAAHFISIDAGVRAYLLDVLRAHLPRHRKVKAHG